MPTLHQKQNNQISESNKSSKKKSAYVSPISKVQTLARIQQLIIMEKMMLSITCYLSACQHTANTAIPDGRVLGYDFSISDISRLPEEMSQWLPVCVWERVADHMSARRISRDRHIAILHPHGSALVSMG
jgi:hypothetical protein